MGNTALEKARYRELLDSRLMRCSKASLALMLLALGCPKAHAVSPAEHAASIERLCVAKRPASISYQKCLMDQEAICARTSGVLRPVQSTMVDCSVVMGLVAKDEAAAAAKQGLSLKRTQASANPELQAAPKASGWLPNQMPSPGTFAIDNILSYLPTPSPDSERRCVDLTRQKQEEVLIALRDRRAAITFSERWSIKRDHREHLARNSEIYPYIRAYAPTCLKGDASDVLVLQVWMDAIGESDGFPYSERALQRSTDRFKQARKEMRDTINARVQEDLDAQKAALIKRKQMAIERGAPHLFGVYLGAPVQASMPRCDSASAQTCWSGSPGGQNEVIVFNDAERPSYLGDLDPNHITPGKSPQGLCDFNDDDCNAAMTVPAKRGLGRIVAFDTVDTNVERIRFRTFNDVGTVANVSEILTTRMRVKPEVSKKSPRVFTSIWRSSTATATMACDAQDCLIVLQSAVFESALQQRRAAERQL